MFWLVASFVRLCHALRDRSLGAAAVLFVRAVCDGIFHLPSLEAARLSADGSGRLSAAARSAGLHRAAGTGAAPPADRCASAAERSAAAAR